MPCHLNLEQFHCEGGVMLYQIIVINKMWARTFELELRWQSSKCYDPVWKCVWKNALLMKLMVILAYDVNGIPGCHLVLLRRGVQSWLKIPSFYVIMLQCTKQTLLKGVLQHCGWEVLQHFPYFHVFPTSVHVTVIPKQKQPLSGKWFAERTF